MNLCNTFMNTQGWIQGTLGAKAQPLNVSYTRLLIANSLQMA